MENPSDVMRRFWNERARKNAEFYIETDHWDGDHEAFFRLGETIARQVIDPALPDRRGLALDVGCGVGRFTRALASRFDRAIGLDVSDEMIARGRGLNAGHPRVDLRATDGVTYPVESGAVDFAFSYVVFQHMPSRAVIQRNLDEIARVLQPGGVALLHMKHRYKTLAHALWQSIPPALSDPPKRLMGRDPLMMSQTYRGVGPLSRRELEARFAQAGLNIQALTPDETHQPAHEYVFVHARRA